MRMNMKTFGLSETILALGKMPGINKTSKNLALADVGKKILSSLKSTARSKWGKSVSHGMRSKVWKDTERVNIFQKGYNKPTMMSRKKPGQYAFRRMHIVRMLEFGRTTKITPKSRAYLRHHGIFLRKSTTSVTVRAKPVFSLVFDSIKSSITGYFAGRFFYQLQRQMRRAAYHGR